MSLDPEIQTGSSTGQIRGAVQDMLASRRRNTRVSALLGVSLAIASATSLGLSSVDGFAVPIYLAIGGGCVLVAIASVSMFRAQRSLDVHVSELRRYEQADALETLGLSPLDGTGLLPKMQICIIVMGLAAVPVFPWIAWMLTLEDPPGPAQSLVPMVSLLVILLSLIRFFVLLAQAYKMRAAGEIYGL